MAIRAWHWAGLQNGYWDPVNDKRVDAAYLAPLLSFPEDYHLFILTIYQVEEFEHMVSLYPSLTIHYKQKKPSRSYRYPTEGPKLVTYILKHKGNV